MAAATLPDEVKPVLQNGIPCVVVSCSSDGAPNTMFISQEYYVADRPSCPRMYGDQPKRAEFLSNMIRDFKVDGAIGEQLKFCDNWIVEHYMNELDFKEAGVPFLKLEREYIVSGIGQLRTRVQAFIETMGK